MNKRIKIVALLPSLSITGGIRRFLEIGNELVQRGYDYTVVVPDNTHEKPEWFVKHHFLAKKTIIIAIHDAGWVIEPYREFLSQHPNTPIVLVNRKLKQIFSEGVVIEGGVNTKHFTPKKLRIGYHAQYAGNVKNSNYIVEQLSDLPHIELVPVRNTPNEDLPKVYRSLDYFVAWEREGAWCNTAAEALACGIPVVTNGVNCEPFADKVIVVDSLKEFFDSPLKELSYSRFVDKLLALFETVLNDEEKDITKVSQSTTSIPKSQHPVLDTLVANFKPWRYLEVGIGTGENLEGLDIEEKVGIDIAQPTVSLGDNVRLYQGKSDDVFVSNEFRQEGPFDLIFIDAYHEFRQCVRDFSNSLSLLNEDGIIVIHDVWPFDQVTLKILIMLLFEISPDT